MGTFFLLIGLAAFGAAFYEYVRWRARSAHRLRHAIEFQWRYERLFPGKLRRGEISKDAFADSFIRKQRFIIKWILTPVTAAWVAACLTGAFLSLTSR